MKMKQGAKKPILITEYNPRWSMIYNREKKKIIAAIGSKVLAIEHIGSTSVVGLAAKPVSDIMVAIESFSLTNELIKPLSNIGYKYVPEYEINLPDRRFFHRGPSETTGLPNRHFHLHIVEKDSEFWVTHILFRDYLRNHTNVAQEYANLKKRLAIAGEGNINKYCEGKNGFIQKVIRLAKEERAKNLKPHAEH